VTFPCIYCQGPTETMDSRYAGSLHTRKGYMNNLPNIRRRRKCKSCGARFTTREVHDDMEPSPRRSRKS